MRALQVAEMLADDHEVTLLAPASSATAGTERPPADLPFEYRPYRPPSPAARGIGLVAAAVAGRSLQSGLYVGGDLARVLPQLARRADLVLLQLARLEPFVRHLGGTPFVADLVDSLALSFRRRALHDRPWLGPVWRAEGRRLARAEGRLAAAARATLVVAERDRMAVAASAAGGAARIEVVPLAFPAAAAAPEPAASPPTLVVTGNLGYFPTLEGVLWWLDAVWPRLRSGRPELRLVLAGARPPRHLLRAAHRAGVEVRASPPDLGAVLAEARVALAPMRAGAGQPLKVMEAWRAGVPVVAHPWAAAGTTGRPGEDLLVAEEPAEWCSAVGRLLDDRDLAARVAEAGRRRLAADYSPPAVAGRLAAAIAAAAPARNEP